MDKNTSAADTSAAIVTTGAADQLVGGTYLMDKDGVRTLVTPPTADHQDGNGPRAAPEEAPLAAPQSPATPGIASRKTALAVVKDAAVQNANPANPANTKGGDQ